MTQTLCLWCCFWTWHPLNVWRSSSRMRQSKGIAPLRYHLRVVWYLNCIRMKRVRDFMWKWGIMGCTIICARRSLLSVSLISLLRDAEGDWWTLIRNVQRIKRIVFLCWILDYIDFNMIIERKYLKRMKNGKDNEVLRNIWLIDKLNDGKIGNKISIAI